MTVAGIPPEMILVLLLLVVPLVPSSHMHPATHLRLPCQSLGKPLCLTKLQSHTWNAKALQMWYDS